MLKSVNNNINKDISKKSDNMKKIFGSPEQIYNSKDPIIKKNKDLKPNSKEENYYPKGMKKKYF